MENPFKKMFGGGDTGGGGSSVEGPAVENREVVEPDYENHGDYYDFLIRVNGKETRRQRAQSSPEDTESLKAEYKAFQRDAGVPDESEFTM